MPRLLSLGTPAIVLAIVAGIVVADNVASHRMHAHTSAGGSHRDPVCGMDVGTSIAYAHDGTDYIFCTTRCRNLFIAAPSRYLTLTCPVCKARGVYTPVETNAFPARWEGKTYFLCTAQHQAEFQSDPAGFFLHTMWGIPAWLYYSSIAIILFVSFVAFEWRGARDRTTYPGIRKNPGVVARWRQGRPRLDLMYCRPIAAIIRAPRSRFLARAVFVFFFLFIIGAGLFGDQLPARNIAPLVTWTLWWGGLIVLILYAGSAWCYVCPWQAIAEWMEGFRLWGIRKDGMSLGLQWPRALRNVWPAILLFVALTWIELGFGATLSPRMTAYLAIGFVGLAIFCAFVFDRASFCRYACFVGRIIGLYSMFAPVEVRARDLNACRSCTTQSCFKGNNAGDPCPTFQYLPGMEENAHCITCMECVKSCEKNNVSVSARPWGEDLATLFRPRSDEATLALVLLALTGFHGFTMTAGWREMLSILDDRMDLGQTASFTLGMLGLVFVPVAMYATLVAMSWALGGRSSTSYRDYFVRYAYALLPIALFYHLAHNSEHLLVESQRIVPLLSDPFGWDWDLFGTAGRSFAPLVRLPALWMIQVLLVLIGHVYSLYYARRIASSLFPTHNAIMRSQFPMLLAMVLFSLTSLWLLKQPMEMRVSAM